MVPERLNDGKKDNNMIRLDGSLMLEFLLLSKINHQCYYSPPQERIGDVLFVLLGWKVVRFCLFLSVDECNVVVLVPVVAAILGIKSGAAVPGFTTTTDCKTCAMDEVNDEASSFVVVVVLGVGVTSAAAGRFLDVISIDDDAEIGDGAPSTGITFFCSFCTAAASSSCFVAV